MSLLGSYNNISSMGLSVGDESFGHYSEVGEGLLIEVLMYVRCRNISALYIFLYVPSSPFPQTLAIYSIGLKILHLRHSFQGPFGLTDYSSVSL